MRERDMQSNVYLKFYLTEKQLHQSKSMSEWLLETARALGVPGGSVFRAVAGFGRHGRLHEETFFELGADLPIQVEFVLEPTRANQLLGVIAAENISLPYVRYVVECGNTLPQD
jgi:PII-like signaling protein